jgi:hypothetical protein
VAGLLNTLLLIRERLKIPVLESSHEVREEHHESKMSALSHTYHHYDSSCNPQDKHKIALFG